VYPHPALNAPQRTARAQTRPLALTLALDIVSVTPVTL
jgi:hypothetical protein